MRLLSDDSWGWRTRMASLTCVVLEQGWQGDWGPSLPLDLADLGLLYMAAAFQEWVFPVVKQKLWSLRAQGEKVHTTTHHLLLIKTRPGANPDLKGGETDSTSWWKRLSQPSFDTQSTTPPQTTLPGLKFCSGRSCFIVNLSSVHCN